MNIKRTIRKIADKTMAEYGFEFDESESGKVDSRGGVYFYKSTKNGCFREIYFQTDSYAKEMEVRLSFVNPNDTSQNIGIAGLNNFTYEVDRFYYKGKKYDTQEKLEGLITELLELIVCYAIPAFEIMEKPLIYPDEEMYRELSKNTKEKAEWFAKEYGLTFDISYEGFFEQVNKLQSIVRSKKGSYEELKPFFINAAAYFGELLIIDMGENSRWDDNSEYQKLRQNDVKVPKHLDFWRYLVYAPQVKHIGNPLLSLVFTWNKQVPQYDINWNVYMNERKHGYTGKKPID